MAFFEEIIDSYGLTEEEWDTASASAGSNLGLDLIPLAYFLRESFFWFKCIYFGSCLQTWI